MKGVYWSETLPCHRSTVIGPDTSQVHGHRPDPSWPPLSSSPPTLRKRLVVVVVVVVLGFLP